MIYLPLICSFLLLIDTLFSLYYFRYTYFIELKRRYAHTKGIPFAYQYKLRHEIATDSGLMRQLIQALYLPWVVFCVFASIWYLPIALSLTIFVVNVFYNKPYISPLTLWLQLASFFIVYSFSIYCFFIKFV